MFDDRKALRFQITAEAHASPQNRDIITKISVRDISTIGMGAYTDFLYRIGDLVFVKLKLTVFNNEVIRELLMGEVRWSTKIDKEKKYAIGIEFLEEEERHPRMSACLHELEQTFFPRPNAITTFL